MNAPLRISWHILSVALVLAGPALALKGPIWVQSTGNLLPLFLVAAGYLASVAVLSVKSKLLSTETSAVGALVIAACVFSIVFLFILMTRAAYARSALLAACLVAACAMPLSRLPRRAARWAVPLLVLAVVSALSVHLARALSVPAQPSPTSSTRILSTSLYAVRARRFRHVIEPPSVPGGGIARLGDDYLAATGDGRIFLIKWAANKKDLVVRDLGIHVPINSEAFMAWATPRHVPQAYRFRVNGLMVHQTGDSVEVFASHDFFVPSKRCFLLRVSAFKTDRETLENRPTDIRWRTVFDTSPCLPVIKKGRGNSWAGFASGGQMAMLDDNSLLLTVGDFEFDGWNSPQDFDQDKTTSYGKTLLISLDTGTARIFTLGNRNDEGLFITPSGDIWATEQGPRGGDELNLLVDGGNYGWPLVTYGTDYESLVWPLNKTQGRHKGFRRPAYAWIPSIGVSALIGVEGSRFSLWKGDLIAASLRAKTLFRIGLVDRIVKFVEPIEIGSQIRDLVEGKDGRIMLWMNDADIISLSPAVGASNPFLTRCSGCHAIGNGTLQNSIGPDLRGVFGRKIASAPKFRYSPALLNLRGAWTAKNLDRFLRSPRTFAPGTSMDIAGIDNRLERKEIIAFLKAH